LDRQPVTFPDGSGVHPDQYGIVGDRGLVDVVEF
jgi:hypothetical protein